jgi:hypothetical protein
MIGRKRAIRSGNRKGYQVWGEVHATAEDDLNRRGSGHFLGIRIMRPTLAEGRERLASKRGGVED